MSFPDLTPKTNKCTKIVVKIRIQSETVVEVVEMRIQSEIVVEVVEIRIQCEIVAEIVAG